MSFITVGLGQEVHRDLPSKTQFPDLMASIEVPMYREFMSKKSAECSIHWLAHQWIGVDNVYTNVRLEVLHNLIPHLWR